MQVFLGAANTKELIHKVCYRFSQPVCFILCRRLCIYTYNIFCPRWSYETPAFRIISCIANKEKQCLRNFLLFFGPLSPFHTKRTRKPWHHLVRAVSTASRYIAQKMVNYQSSFFEGATNFNDPDKNSIRRSQEVDLALICCMLVLRMQVSQAAYQFQH